MRVLKQSLIALVFSCPAILMAQNIVKGSVTDQTTNTTLSGAEVTNITSGNSVVADEKGSFTIEANDGDIIVISYFGYDDQEYTYTGQDQIQFSLIKSSETNLEEVVVIGYGTAKKEDVTGAVNQISEKDFNKGSITSAQELVTGKIAGVVVTSAGGAPGDGQNIIIRGNSSLSLTSQPLYVIDGVPIEGGVAGSRNALDFINPNDIETMTILKDASATAIYGSRAANGVVLVTTKKGRERNLHITITQQHLFINQLIL